MVILFDAESGERISDATVTSSVTPLGMTPAQKWLDPKQINDTTTYGNFFDFPASSSPFRIEVRITRPSLPAHNAVSAESECRSPFSK